MSYKLREKGYPNDIIEKARQKARDLDRTDLLKPKLPALDTTAIPTVLVSTYQPNFAAYKQFVKTIGIY